MNVAFSYKLNNVKRLWQGCAFTKLYPLQFKPSSNPTVIYTDNAEVKTLLITWLPLMHNAWIKYEYV